MKQVDNGSLRKHGVLTVSRRNNRNAVFFLLPTIIFMLVLMVIPIIMGVSYSFTDYNPISGKANYIGLENFTRLFQSVRFIAALKNTFLLIVFYVPVLNILAITMAAIIGAIGKKLGNFYKSLILYPNLLAMVVVGFVWRLFFDFNNGLMNQSLRFLGLDFLTAEWLGNPDTVLLSVTIVLVWYSLGYFLVLYVAGIMAIPEDMYEAADIEGCNALQKFLHITLPMLSTSITINVVMSTMTAFTCFDLIISLTDGGPGFSSTILALEVRENAFKRSEYAMGITIGVILGILGILIMLLELRFLLNREEKVYG